MSSNRVSDMPFNRRVPHNLLPTTMVSAVFSFGDDTFSFLFRLPKILNAHLEYVHPTF